MKKVRNFLASKKKGRRYTTGNILDKVDVKT